MPCLSYNVHKYGSTPLNILQQTSHLLTENIKPSPDQKSFSETMMTVETEPVSSEWVGQQLTEGLDLLLLDCRPSNDYNISHIQGAIPVAIPTLMLKRLKKGNLPVESVIKCQKFHSKWRTDTLILYDDDTSDLTASPSCLLSLLYKRLVEDGCKVHFLQGGFAAFQANHTHLCIGPKDTEESTILGLCNLQITDSEPPKEEDDPPSPTNSSPFPVEVLPHLFLGNAKNSSDLSCLFKNGIKYILNVTPNIPNTFETKGDFRYMQIPITDHWSQNLSAFFPDAIAFIDEARQKSCGVLVHCLAGISRSVTVTVAYLMYSRSLSLNDAYDVVKKCKPNISPNFNFMGQLLDFERKLGHSLCSCPDGRRPKSPTDDQDMEDNNHLTICNCKKETKTFFSSPTCTSSSVSSTSSVSSSSSLAMSSASSNTAFDYDISPS